MMFYPVARRRILAVEGGLREQCAGVCASWFFCGLVLRGSLSSSSLRMEAT